jgi:tetratricopeptide (TPR) repeat protein
MAQAPTYAARIGEARRKLDALEQRLAGPEVAPPRFAAEGRMREAKAAYAQAQYGQASKLFLEVVLRTTPQSFGSHREALYLLGDSLMKQRNFSGARMYLGRVVALGAGAYYQESLEALLQIAYETENYEGINELYAKMDSVKGASPAVSYLRGKSLFEQGRLEEARLQFAEAMGSADFKLMALYFDGAVLVSLKRLDEAKLRFEQVVAVKPKNAREERVYYMSYLALGRLAHEQGRYEEALDMYNRLPRTDPNFARAIYEATWALVQMEKYKAAQENIDALRYLGDANPTLYMQAMLLRADLSMRVKDYKTALESFEEVLSRYDAAYQQMTTFAATQPDLPGYFLSLVGEDLKLRSPQGLPTLRAGSADRPAEEWLVEGRQLTKARAAMGDVSATRQGIKETLLAIEGIQSKLDNEAPLRSSPHLAESAQAAVVVEAELLAIRRELVEREAALKRGAMSEGAQASWQTLEAQLRALQAAYEKTPRTAQELAAREAAADRAFDGLRKELDELGYTITNLQTRLAAVDSHMAAQQATLSAEARQALTTEREALRQEMAKAEQLRVQLRQRMEAERQQLAQGDGLTTQEHELRLAYRRKLAEASDFLTQQAGSGVEFDQLNATRAELAPLEARIDGLRSRVLKLADERLARLRQEIDAERKLVEAQSQELEQLVVAARQVTAAGVYKNFVQKLGEFEATILRADVGKIDVLFQQKEDASGQINELFQQRTDELRKLQESFEEVR